jgi:hypothetical protein
VLRRTAYGLPPAEILAPEVASIIEIPEGLSIVSNHPKQRLMVSRSVDGFAEVRDQLRSWAPIATYRGVRAYVRLLAHSWGSGERTRHHIDGALAVDPTLLGELTAVRTLAMPFDPRSVRARRSLRILIVLWVLVVLLLAIWQLRAVTPGFRPDP